MVHRRKPRFMLRLCVKVPNRLEIQHIANTMMDRLASCASVVTTVLAPVSQEPELNRLYIELESVGADTHTFQRIMDCVGPGWERYDSGQNVWAVWSPRVRDVPQVPRLQWANLEILHDVA
jgi:hypothetical protein